MNNQNSQQYKTDVFMLMKYHMHVYDNNYKYLHIWYNNCMLNDIAYHVH